MSIADHFDHRSDAGFVRAYDAQAARRQFQISIMLVAVLAIAAVPWGAGGVRSANRNGRSSAFTGGAITSRKLYWTFAADREKWAYPLPSGPRGSANTRAAFRARPHFLTSIIFSLSLGASRACASLRRVTMDFFVVRIDRARAEIRLRVEDRTHSGTDLRSRVRG